MTFAQVISKSSAAIFGVCGIAKCMDVKTNGDNDNNKAVHSSLSRPSNFVLQIVLSSENQRHCPRIFLRVDTSETAAQI